MIYLLKNYACIFYFNVIHKQLICMKIDLPLMPILQAVTEKRQTLVNIIFIFFALNFA